MASSKLWDRNLRGLTHKGSTELRAIASTAIGQGFKGGCPITTIAVLTGLKEDPALKTTLMIIKNVSTHIQIR